MLNAKDVHDLFLKLLFHEDEIDETTHQPKSDVSTIRIEGITQNFGLHGGRVLEHKDEIHSMLEELNPVFKEGYTFMQMPFDKDDRQWGEQPTAQELMVMGMAIGELKYCFPREMWMMLPGSVPYIIYTGGKNDG